MLAAVGYSHYYCGCGPGCTSGPFAERLLKRKGRKLNWTQTAKTSDSDKENNYRNKSHHWPAVKDELIDMQT